MHQTEAGRPLNTGGFTLVELMFVAVLTAILALVVGTIFQKGTNLYDVESAQSNTQRNARKIVYSVTSMLRQARTGSVNIPSPPGNNQITFDLPLFASGGSCSAFAPVTQGTNPVSCSATSDCDNTCNGGAAIANNVCVNSICRRTYTYSVLTSGNMSQLVVNAPTEAPRVVGNQVQAVTFQNNTMDLNLQPNEVRVSLTTRASVVSEKRSHDFNLSSIAQMRN